LVNSDVTNEIMDYIGVLAAMAVSAFNVSHHIKHTQTDTSTCNE